jgi:hypothetical protein
LLKKRRSLLQASRQSLFLTEGGLTSTSEEEPSRLGAVLRKAVRRDDSKGASFQKLLEFTTSATSEDGEPVAKPAKRSILSNLESIRESSDRDTDCDVFTTPSLRQVINTTDLKSKEEVH